MVGVVVNSPLPPHPQSIVGLSAGGIQVTPSSNIYLNAIQWNGWMYKGVVDPGTGLKYTTGITYYFDDTGPGGAWQSYEKTGFRAALQSWENVADIKFVETSNINEANLIEHKGSNASMGLGVWGLHESPQEASTVDDGSTVGNTHGWFNWGSDLFYGADVVGSHPQYIYLQQIGHALGLADPHQYDGGSGIFPGVTPTSNSLPENYGDHGLNQGIYTVMSQYNGFPTQFGFTGIYNYGNSAGPSAFDIAAVQHLYGANTSYRTGDDTYVIPDVNDTGTYWTAIWDAGGVDWIVYDGLKNVKIDLTAATLDNSPTGGGVASSAEGIHGGFTIANGVVIEKARGGYGNDTINGNDANNTVHGGQGNDIIKGFGGIDRLNGQGNDDIVHGGEGEDSLYGEGGKDKMNGQNGNDWLWGGLGNDQLYGETGTDRMWGMDDHDYLVGGDGNDFLYGDAGNDFLDGGKGADELTGGSGNDKFYFRLGNGAETILDFNNTAGNDDAISLEATGLATFDAVMATTANVTGGVMITLNATDSIFLANVTKESLTVSDFIFS